MRRRFPVLLWIICWGVTPALAAPVPITVPNFSFEDPAVGDGSATGSIPGWTASSGGGGLVLTGLHDLTSSQYPGATDNLAPLPGSALGYQNAFITLRPEAATSFAHLNTGPLATVTVDTEYVLTVALGNRLDVDPADFHLSLTGDGDAFVSLVLRPGGPGLIPEGTFVDYRLAFTVLPGNSYIGAALGIELWMQTPAGSPLVQGNFDNIRLTSEAIPEPSGAALVLSSALVMALTRRGEHRGHREEQS